VPAASWAGRSAWPPPHVRLPGRFGSRRCCLRLGHGDGSGSAAVGVACASVATTVPARYQSALPAPRSLRLLRLGISRALPVPRKRRGLRLGCRERCQCHATDDASGCFFGCCNFPGAVQGQPDVTGMAKAGEPPRFRPRNQGDRSRDPARKGRISPVTPRFRHVIPDLGSPKSKSRVFPDVPPRPKTPPSRGPGFFFAPPAGRSGGGGGGSAASLQNLPGVYY
jgi:hypothetical protein